MRKICLALIFLTCSAFGDFFPSKTSYRHLVGDFETEKECEDFKKETGEWFNCFRAVTFEVDGFAMVMLTDIANRAEYSIENGSEIILKSVSPGDMPDTMTFEILSESQIYDSYTGKVWELF